MSNCSSGCTTQDHASYGECMKSKGVRLPAIGIEGQAIQKKADKTLDEYAKARSYGIQPKSTRAADIEAAVRRSEQTGSAHIA